MIAKGAVSIEVLFLFIKILFQLFNREHVQHYLCGCFFTTQKKNEQREEQYQAVIQKKQEVIEE